MTSTLGATATEAAAAASVLDYDVPEAVIYSGRSFIQLDLSRLTEPKNPQRLFLPYSLGPPSLRPQIISLTPTQGGPDTPVVVTGSGFLREGTQVSFGGVTVDQAAVDVTASTELIAVVPATARTGPLTIRTKYGTASSVVPFVVQADMTSRASAHDSPGDVLEMARAGVPVQRYRTALGTTGVRYVDPPPGPLGPDDPPPDEPSPQPAPTQPIQAPSRVLISIRTPQGGDSRSGPPGGVPIDVAGVVTLQNVADPVVMVTVGSGPTSRAAFDDDALCGWSVSTKTTQQGRVTIKATVTGRDTLERPLSDSSEVTINVTQVAMPPGDSRPPQLEITTPLDNACIQPAVDASPPFPVAVPVAGKALDVAAAGETASGTKSVDVMWDGDPSTRQAAQPVAAGNWSSWSLPPAAQPRLSEGLHTITVRAVDQKGNSITQNRTVVVARAVPLETQLFLVEEYRLSSFLGDYGAGRTIRTLSLLPGEKLKISIKSYTRSSEERREASSVLDSFNSTSAEEFQRATQSEQTTKDNYEESFKYNVQGHAEATWGWGKASVDAGVSGGSNAAREEIAKNIANATRKSASTASAKRDVTISTSRDVKTESGVETTFDQEVENINVGRTLNFVFRQMNQEYITILHLVDVRIGVVQVFDKARTQLSYHEITLPQLGGLLDLLVAKEYRRDLAAVIEHQLMHVLNYAGHEKSLAQKCKMSDGSEYLRFHRQTSTWREDPSNANDPGKEVFGVILNGAKHVLRTDGVVCDAILGQGDALDAYSRGLQDEAVEARTIANRQAELEAQKLELALQLVRGKDAPGAELFARVFPPSVVTPEPDAGRATVTETNGSAWQ
jgi:hypothetical protein